MALTSIIEPATRLGVGLVLAAACAGVVVLLQRTRRPILYTALLACLPGLVVNIANPSYRTVGYHAWMHSAFTYQCMARLGNLEDVLCAGMNVRYAWGHHMMVGVVSKTLGVAPTISVLVLDAIMMIGSVALLSLTAVLIGVPRRSANLAGVLGIAGCTVVHAGLAMYAVRFLSPLIGDARWIPYWKFFGFNNNQCGIFLFCLFLYCAVRLLAGMPRPALAAAGLALAQGLGGFCYPLAWMGMGAASAAMLLGVVVVRRWDAAKSVAWYVGASALGTGSILPYLLAINRGKTNPEAALHLDLSARSLWIHAVSLSAAVAVPLLLAAVHRNRVRDWLAAQRGVLPLACSGVGVGGLYLLVSVPFVCDYKFLAMVFLALGPLIAWQLVTLMKSHRLVSLVLFTLMLHPVSLGLTHHLRAWTVFEPCFEQGTDLRATDPAVDAVYTFLKDLTPTDSVVIDVGLCAPTLGRRSLYIAIPDPRLAGVVPGVVHTQDGWLNSADQMLYWLSGYEPAMVEARRDTAKVLLGLTADGNIAAAAKKVRADVGRRTVLVVCRDAQASERLAKAGVELVKQTPAAFIHALAAE